MRSGIIDIGAGLFSLLCAAVFYSQTGDLEGVGLLYPRAILLFIAAGGLYTTGLGLYEIWRGAKTAEKEEPVALVRVGMISLLSITYVAILSALGFYTATALFLFTSALVLDDTGSPLSRRALAACILTISLCLAVWVIFSLLLYIPTPAGWFLKI